MNFATQYIYNFSFYDDVSLDINLLGILQILDNTEFPILLTPLAGCPPGVSKSVPGSKACPLSDCPNCPHLE